MSTDLYSFMATFTDLRDLVFSYLCPYEDNRSVLRQLSTSFYNLPLFETLAINRQPRAFLARFFRTNRVRKLVIRSHNRNLFRIPRDPFQHVHKINAHSLDGKELHLMCKLLSRFCVTNLRIKYCTCTLPTSISSFCSLERLDITITSKENQDAVFNLLRSNRATLKKLKIGIYTGNGIDEAKVQEIIERDLRLEHIDIRGDLFSYEMIRPCTRRIAPVIPYVESKTDMLRYIVRLRLEGLANRHLPILFRTLAVVEKLSLYGGLENYEHVSYIDNNPFEYVLRSYGRDLSLPYDGSVANIETVQSAALTFLFMNGFTIRSLPPAPLKEMILEDVCFLKPVNLPVLQSLFVENEVMDPTRFTLATFTMPRLNTLSLIHCLIKDAFLYHHLTNIAIQHSIISIDVGHLIQKHKQYLTSVLFYMNRWPEGFIKEELLRFAKQLRIEAREPGDW